MRKILLIFCVIASLSLGVLSACQHSKKQDSISEADMDVSLQEDQVEEAVEEAPSPAVESENDTAQNNDLTDEELLLPVFVTNNQERKFGYMNQSEEWIIPPEYDSADFFSKEGVALVSKGGTAYMIDINGNIITDIKIGDSVGLVERLWSTDSFAKADFIHGNVTILWYDSDYQSKFAPKAHIGFMDMDGNVTNLHHDLVLDSDFNNTMVEAGLYKITNETSGKEGYINTKGEIVIPVEFDTLGLLGHL